ncbi:cupin domain-containing protein [Clostridium sp. AM58-1XD]|uniref:cupin domain-containing protein n=1 Tax=Clostridium sp. AM58-1XD TaxID=2292307 RepID=UPI000E52AC06|nr:cupin domain-containing protein [Clostridium sp. AM58-1XD]RGY98068.1 cupin domain-containing protein [Clostridium sp. AM58-1XD]
MAELNLVRIGRLLKSQRMMLGLSIRDLSARSGVAAGTISQIETGKTSPNLVSIYSLCENLGFPISALFVEESDERINLIRKNERPSFTRNVSAGKEITESLITRGNSEMWGGIITMPPHTDSGAFYYHEGEEFAFILKGTLIFELEGHPVYELHSQDTLYYPNEIGHRWENRTDEEVQFMIVSTSEYKNEPPAE